jgi:hypothetical protein
LVVGDIEDGQSGQISMQAGDLFDHGPADLRVERRQRLVKQEHARTHGERACDRHALLLSAGQFARVARKELLHADDAKRVIDPLFDQLFRGAAGLEAEGDVVSDPHVGKERIVLHDHRQATLVRGQVGHIGAADMNAPRSRSHEASDGPQRRRLARSRRANHREDFAGRDVEGERLEDDRATIGDGDRVEPDGRMGANRLRRDPCARRLRAENGAAHVSFRSLVSSGRRRWAGP